MAAIAQIRLDTAGRRYYRRKLEEAKTRKEARRCLKRRLSDMVYRQLIAEAMLTEHATIGAYEPHVGAGPEGTRGRHPHPSRPTCTLRSSALRISHNPNPQHRATRPPRPPDTPGSFGSPLTASARRSRQRGAPHRTSAVDGDKHWRTLGGAETAL